MPKIPEPTLLLFCLWTMRVIVLHHLLCSWARRDTINDICPSKFGPCLYVEIFVDDHVPCRKWVASASVPPGCIPRRAGEVRACGARQRRNAREKITTPQAKNNVFANRHCNVSVVFAHPYSVFVRASSIDQKFLTTACPLSRQHRFLRRLTEKYLCTTAPIQGQPPNTMY